MTELCTTGGEVRWQEDIVQRIRKPDEQPREPNKGSRDANTLRSVKTLQMYANLPRIPLTLRPSTFPTSRRATASLHLLERKTARPTILLRNCLKRLDTLRIAVLADEELWRFVEMYDREAEHGHKEDEGAGCVPDVAPALVVGVCACCCGGAGVVWQEGPGEEAGD